MTAVQQSQTRRRSLLSASGCAFITNLTSAGGADASAFTVNMDKYEVKSLSIAAAGKGSTLCPGAKVKVLAQAVERKGSKGVTLETAAVDASGNDARGKMDPAEFAMAARGGAIEERVFATTRDPFAVLLGYDLKATYRLDTSKEATLHFAPEYSCFGAVGLSGSSGNRGSQGPGGSAGGGGGGYGGPGGPGSPGPEVVAVATIVQTPLYDRVGMIRVAPTGESTLFDLDAGMTVVASGGAGGDGGPGGTGGVGQKPEGAGGPGGVGGDGGPGGDGGQILLIIDDRYPELEAAVRLNVAGGMAGQGGYGGNGGNGSPA